MRLSDFLGISNKKGGTGDSRAVGKGVSSTEQLNRQIKALTPGQTIHGEIISRSGSEVQIRLSGDMVLNARLEQSMNLELGRGMTFEVKNNGSSLTLSPLFANTATDENVLKALAQASLPVNGTTVEMTGLMMEAGLSVSREALGRMFRDVGAYPEASIRDIVDLRSLGMPVNEGNLEQMASYRNLSHQLVSGMQDIVGELSGILQELAQSGETGRAASLYASLMELAGELNFGSGSPGDGLFGAGGAGMAAGVLDGGLFGAGGAGMASGALDPAGVQAGAGGAGMASGALDPAGVQVGAGGAGMASGALDPAGVQVGTAAAGMAAGALDGKHVVSGGAAGADMGNPADAALEQNGEASAAAVSGRRLAGPLRGLLDSLAPSAGDGQRLAARMELLEAGKLNGQESFRLAAELLRQAGLSQHAGTEKAIRSFLGSKDWGQFLRGALLDNWTLPPGALREEGRLTELYNRLNRQLHTLSQALESAGQSQSGAMQSTAALSRNLDFLQQLNQLYTYVQLPLKMSGGTAHGDLYVYTNRKHLAEKDGSVSALLHLDMQNLGPLDVYVALQSGRLGTHFYVQDEEMLDFLGRHMDLLTRRLKDQGYDVRCDMQVREQGKAGEAQPQPGLKGLAGGGTAVPLAQYSFDVRA